MLDQPRRLGTLYLQWEFHAIRNAYPIEDRVTEPTVWCRMAQCLQPRPPD